MQSLSKRFFGCDEGAVPVVSDSQAASRWAGGQGHDFLHISEALDRRRLRQCILIGTTSFWYSQLTYLRGALADAAVLWLPLAAFDGSADVVEYGLDQMSRIDWNSAAEEQAAVSRLFAQRHEYDIADSRGNVLSVNVPPLTRVSFGDQGVVSQGEFRSLLTCLEVETEYVDDRSDPIQADGEINIDSLLYAHGPRTIVEPHQRTQAESLCSEVGRSAESRLVVSGGLASSFVVGGLERLPQLLDLAGPRLGSRITEFSFGLNSDLRDMRWDLNSPFNEGAHGVHLGLGDGYSGTHLDFVASMARVKGRE